MERAYLPSEALLLEFMQLAATQEGWIDLARRVLRRRALHQVLAVAEVCEVEQRWRLPAQIDDLKDAVAVAERIREYVWHELAKQQLDPLAIARSMLDRFDESLRRLSRVGPELRERVDEYLAQRHRHLAMSGDLSEGQGLVGLALSGGGIRSASFSIGVLQALARDAVLPALHYVSAVSGGGYAASWLVAWACRHRAGIAGVQEELFGSGGECGPLKWVRRYGSYLAHQLGPLSTDAWSLIVAYLRNWVPVFFLVVGWLVPVMLLPYLALRLGQSVPPLWVVAAGASVAMAFVTLLRYLMQYRRTDPRRPQSGGVRWWVAFLAVAASLLLALAIDRRADIASASANWRDMLSVWLPAGIVGTWDGARELLSVLGTGLALPAGMLLYLAAWAAAGVLVNRRRIGAALGRGLRMRASPADAAGQVEARVSPSVAAGTAAIGGLVFGLGLAACAHAQAYLKATSQQLLTVLPLCIALAFGLAETCMIVLTSRRHDDNDRAWQAHVGGWILRALLIWTVLCLVSLQLWQGISSYPTLAVLLVALLASTCMAVPLLERRISAALLWSALVPLLLLIVVAGVVDFIAVRHAKDSLLALSLVIAAMLILAMLGSRFIDINYFSLHDMYRERLTRTFLGASRLEAQNPAVQAPPELAEAEREHQYLRRAPTAFTDIDERDSPSMHWLRPTQARPLPLIVLNAAVNGRSRSEVGGRATRQWCFSFSPYFCGSPANGIGYRATDEYFPFREGKQPMLGAAMALSGAAMSPTAGRMTHPVKALLLGLLNARLGMWVVNPQESQQPQQWWRPGPALGLIKELVSYRPFFSHWIHLSDGGHFENLGVFELVRRGCSRIIVVDASCDPDRSFDDFANAIRRVRIDLGVDIRRSENWEVFGPQAPPPQHPKADLRKSWMWFEIDYGQYAENRPVKGRLLYIKPSVYEQQVLPPDVLQYWQTARRFPHETTADQFFTEAQLEAYRALGETCARSAMKNTVLAQPALTDADQPLGLAVIRRKRPVIQER